MILAFFPFVCFRQAYLEPISGSLQKLIEGRSRIGCAANQNYAENTKTVQQSEVSFFLLCRLTRRL
jgi:hypothetical protein